MLDTIISPPPPAENTDLRRAVTPEHKLQVSNLNFYYGSKQILHGIDLRIAANRVTALIGPSGCGKSTFLRTLNRMYETVPKARAAGEVLLDGEDVLVMEAPILRRRV